MQPPYLKIIRYVYGHVVPCSHYTMDPMSTMYFVLGQVAGVCVLVWRNLARQDVPAHLLFPFDVQLWCHTPGGFAALWISFSILLT